MTSKTDIPASSIAAYEARERIARYDADMDVMHPNRGKMVQIALDFLAVNTPAPAHVLDLGCGTGFAAQRLLERFDGVQVTCLDGASAMLELAQARLAAYGGRTWFVQCGFNALENAGLPAGGFDAVISSYALHHVSGPGKRALLSACRGLLKAGGWCFNADIVANSDPGLEEPLQVLRASGIVQRARGDDARFADVAATRAWLEAMERAEDDQPQSLQEDLDSFAAAGFARTAVLWAEYREVVIGAQK